MRRRLRGRLLGPGPGPARRAGGEGGYRAQWRRGHGPLRHQLLHGDEVGREPAGGLRALRAPGPDGPVARGPRIRHRAQRRFHRPHVRGVGAALLQDPEGRYKREGRWQVMIHGESYKPIVAEAAKKALGEQNIYERIFMSHVLLDKDDPGKVAGAVGFSVRDNKVYVFKGRAVISAAGGATM